MRPKEAEPKNNQDHTKGLAGFGLAGCLAHVFWFGFWCPFAWWGSFCSLWKHWSTIQGADRAVPCPVSDWYQPVGVGLGEQSGVHRAGGHWDLDWGLVLDCL